MTMNLRDLEVVMLEAIQEEELVDLRLQGITKEVGVIRRRDIEGLLLR